MNTETNKKHAVAPSDLTDVLSAIGLQRAQIKKLSFLAERGGKYSAVTVHVGMPDGRLADIDPYGRVTWFKADNAYSCARAIRNNTGEP